MIEKCKMYVIEVSGLGYIPNTDAVECGCDYAEQLCDAGFFSDRSIAKEICDQVVEDGYPAVVREVDCVVH